MMDRTSDLADQRRTKGITLEAIESSTRIARHFLEAIEAEDFAQLPGGVYSTSYLRQYARVTGLDEAALLRHYYEKTKPPVIAERHSTGSRFTRWFPRLPIVEAFLQRLPGDHVSRSHT